jgi:hypothetical protein
LDVGVDKVKDHLPSLRSSSISCLIYARQASFSFYESEAMC